MTIELHDYGLFCKVISPDAVSVFQPYEFRLLTNFCVIDSKSEGRRFIKQP